MYRWLYIPYVGAPLEVRNHVRRHRRQVDGMTQQDLADRVGVTRQTILSIERSSRSPPCGGRTRIWRAPRGGSCSSWSSCGRPGCYSSLLRYWGAKKTAFRVLIVYGSFWAVFVIAAIIGEPPSTPLEAMLAMFMGLVVVAPFFVLARTAGRRPRGTGAVLLVVAAFFFVLTSPTWLARSMESSAMLLTSVLLLVPLIASGLALLRKGSSDDEKAEEVG